MIYQIIFFCELGTCKAIVTIYLESFVAVLESCIEECAQKIYKI